MEDHMTNTQTYIGFFLVVAINVALIAYALW